MRLMRLLRKQVKASKSQTHRYRHWQASAYPNPESSGCSSLLLGSAPAGRSDAGEISVRLSLLSNYKLSGLNLFLYKKFCICGIRGTINNFTCFAINHNRVRFHFDKCKLTFG